MSGVGGLLPGKDCDSDMICPGILLDRAPYEWDSLSPSGMKGVLTFRKLFLKWN